MMHVLPHINHVKHIVKVSSFGDVAVQDPALVFNSTHAGYIGLYIFLF